MELQEVNQRVTALIDAYGQPPELGAGGEPLTEEQSAVYDEEDYSRLRARQEERVINPESSTSSSGMKRV